MMIPQKLRDRARLLCDVMFEVTGVDATEESHRRPVVSARVMVVSALLEEGFSEHAVGTVLGWDHSTINHYRKRMRDIRTMFCFEAERDVWRKFRGRLEEMTQKN